MWSGSFGIIQSGQPSVSILLEGLGDINKK